MNDYIKNPLRKSQKSAILIIYFGLWILILPILVAKLLKTLNMYNDLNLNLMCYVIGSLLVFIFIKTLYFKEKLSNPFVVLRYLLIGFGLCLLVNLIIGTIITFLVSSDTSSNQLAILDMVSSSQVVSYFLMSCVFAPFLEESVFRGVVFRSLREHHSFILCALVSGLLFGFIHVLNSLLIGNFTDLIYMFQYAGLGIVFCFVYEKTKSIRGAVLLHSIYNLFALVVMML